LEGELLAVRVRGLTHRFGARAAVDRLDLDVRRGECLGLLGPNGAGKSTTIRILSSALALQAAPGTEVAVLGLDPAGDGPRLRAKLGVVPQEVALYEGLSARENLAFFGGLYGLGGAALDARVEWGLGLSGLAERAADAVKSYSGGMKRRLNIAASLLHEPELVFLDEPTVGIDPQSRNHVFAMVEKLRAEGTTMVYTSHALGEVERLCDRIVILDRGRAIASGTLTELQRLPALAEARGGAAGGAPRGGSLQLADARQGARARETLAAAGITSQLEETPPSLEEVFLALTGRALRDVAEG
jgi:ABC-2 type transport system ATP-binding protein